MWHVWTVLCSKASIDKESNNVSLYEIVEQMELGVTPDAKLPFEFGFSGDLVALWARADYSAGETGESRTRFCGPAGEVLFEFTTKVDLADSSRNRVITRLNGMKVAKTGVHHFVQSLRLPDGDWKEVAKVPLDITITVVQPSATQTAPAK